MRNPLSLFVARLRALLGPDVAGARQSLVALLLNSSTSLAGRRLPGRDHRHVRALPGSARAGPCGHRAAGQHLRRVRQPAVDRHARRHLPAVAAPGGGARSERPRRDDPHRRHVRRARRRRQGGRGRSRRRGLDRRCSTWRSCRSWAACSARSPCWWPTSDWPSAPPATGGTSTTCPRPSPPCWATCSRCPRCSWPRSSWGHMLTPVLGLVVVAGAIVVMVAGWVTPLPELRRIVRESVPVLFVAGCVSTGAGIALEKSFASFAVYPGAAGDGARAPLVGRRPRRDPLGAAGDQDAAGLRRPDPDPRAGRPGGTSVSRCCSVSRSTCSTRSGPGWSAAGSVPPTRGWAR